MFRSIALAAALLAAPPASAGVLFSFAQEGPTLGWSDSSTQTAARVSIFGQVSLDDGASTGFGLGYRSSGGAIFGVSQRDVPSLLSISVSLLLDGAAFRSFDLARMDGSSFIETFAFSLTGDATGIWGDFSLNDAETSARLQFTGSGFNATVSSDRGDLGCFWGRCTALGGVVASSHSAPPTAVPEPATAALFGMGLLGLWGVRRRAA